MKKYIHILAIAFCLTFNIRLIAAPSKNQELKINNIYGNNLKYSIRGNYIFFNVESPSNISLFVLSVFPNIKNVVVSLSTGEEIYDGTTVFRDRLDYSSNPDIILTHTESGVSRTYKTHFTNFSSQTLGVADVSPIPRVDYFYLYTTTTLNTQIGSCRTHGLNIFCTYPYSSAVGYNLAFKAQVSNNVSTITSTQFEMPYYATSEFATTTTVNVNMPLTFTATGSSGISRKYNLYIDTVINPKSTSKAITLIYDNNYNEKAVFKDNDIYFYANENTTSIAQVNHSPNATVTINGIAMNNSNSSSGYSNRLDLITIAGGMNYPVIVKAQDGSLANYTLYVKTLLGTVVPEITKYEANFFWS